MSKYRFYIISILILSIILGTLQIIAYKQNKLFKNTNEIAKISKSELNDNLEVHESSENQNNIINITNIYQNIDYPTGCESVTAIMALHFFDIDISVDDFINKYLDKTNDGMNFDPNLCFGGDPFSQSGKGCYAPVIKNACNKIFKNLNYKAIDLHDVSLDCLCSKYIDNNIPVIMWATIEMNKTHISRVMENGISWISPEHCLLLVGYDKDNYFFKDPMVDSQLTKYKREDVLAAYAGMLSQAVIIQKR